MRIYLFGPMRGYPEFNFPAFRKAAAELRNLGHEVFSPAEHDEMNGFDPACLTGGQLRADLDWICRRAETLAGLPGWENSDGSLAEVHAAWALGVPVHELGDFLEEGPAAPLIVRAYPVPLKIKGTPAGLDRS
jgi:hypothetical protein